MSEYRNPNPRAYIGTYFVIDMSLIIGAEYEEDDNLMMVYYDSSETLEFRVTRMEYELFLKEYVKYLSGY